MASFSQPPPEEVPGVLGLYKVAEASTDVDMAAFYFNGLVNATLKFPELFNAHPPEVHPALWEAIYVADNDDWSTEFPSVALKISLDRYKHLLLYTTEPDPRIFENWVGHGFGHQGVRKHPIHPVAGPGKKRRALVPGYGQGADAILLAKFYGFDVVALDVSETALGNACDLANSVDYAVAVRNNDDFDSRPSLKIWAAVASKMYGDCEMASGSLEWRHQDFFDKECFDEDEKFDLIYDNYFFSALHPSLRPQWAKKMVDLLARPNGRLLCRETPYVSKKNVQQGGPPYSDALWFYQLHLTYPGNTNVVDYMRGIIDVCPETTMTTGGSRGLTQVGRFLVDDQDNYENKIKTWMSVWAPAMGALQYESVSPDDGPRTWYHTLDVVVKDGKKNIIIKKHKKLNNDHQIGEFDLITPPASVVSKSASRSPEKVDVPFKRRSPLEEGEVRDDVGDTKTAKRAQPIDTPRSGSPSEADETHKVEQETKVAKRVRFSTPSPLPVRVG